MIEVRMELDGEMPPYYKIADFLWGSEANIDSDGDSRNPDSTNWTELTLILRNDEAQRIDIDPIEGEPGLFLLKAATSHLAEKTIRFLKGSGAVK